MNNKLSYLPPFLRDFHDQKTVVKGFYTYLDMMDNRQESLGEKFDSTIRKRRVVTCGWISFQILLISFVDFLHLNGYSIYRTRGKQPPQGDILKDCRDLAELPIVWDSIKHPDEMGHFPYSPLKHCMEVLGRWRNWLHLMPKGVWEFYSEHNPDWTPNDAKDGDA